jgi:DNA repair protein RecO (recombination protein O)
MPSYPLTALVLRKTKLGESDLIVSLLAEDGSHVRAVAKSARKPGSKLAARAEPYVSLDLLLHTGKSLEIIQEARTVKARAAIRSDYDRGAAAAVVVDLLNNIAVEGQAEPRLFALSGTTLDAINDAPTEALPRLVTAFLLKAMAMHGYRPQLGECTSCGGTTAGSVIFSPSAGGVLCSSCAGSDPSALEVPAEALRWLDRLMRSTMAQIEALDMPACALTDCFEVTRAFVVYHLPARLKALDFYAGVVKPRRTNGL